MSNSDKAMKELEKLADYYGNDVEDWEIGIYIKQQEQLQAEHEALKRDVARYFELDKQFYEGFFDEIDNEQLTLIEQEVTNLFEKLSKVGKEE